MSTLDTFAPALVKVRCNEQVECRFQPKARAIPELDGLRGMAILMVMACHTPMEFPGAKATLSLGWTGVDLFFVLSGFLITSILLDSKDRDSPFRNFYARRILRIWPLYFLYLAFVFVCCRPILPESVSSWPFALFVQNSVYRWDVGPFLQPTWSLAVEEQFYLLWPFVILRCSPRTSIRVAAVCLALSPIIRAVGFSFCSNAFLTFNTIVRLDSIALGCLIAVVLRSGALNGLVGRRIATGMVLFGSAGFGLCVLESALDQRCAYSLKYTFIALLFGGALLRALLSSHNGLWRSLLRWPVLRFCGRISFALYLFNRGIMRLCYSNHVASWLDRARLPAPFEDVPNIVLASMLTFSTATLSWHLLESRILKLKAHFQ